MSRLFIIVPAYNEARAIGATLAGLPRSLPGVEHVTVVVIDDGSTDGTADEVRRNAPGDCVLLRHAVNRGLGAALATGLAYARKERADYVVTCDADGQHSAEDLPAMLAPLVHGEADAVIGTRLLRPRGMPWYRIIGNWGLNVVTWAVFGMWTTDSQSGMRAFSRAAIDEIDIRTDRMEVSSEFIKEIRRRRLRFKEVPIRAIYTDYSLAKGQRSSNGVNILLRLLFHRLTEE